MFDAGGHAARPQNTPPSGIVAFLYVGLEKEAGSETVSLAVEIISRNAGFVITAQSPVVRAAFEDSLKAVHAAIALGIGLKTFPRPPVAIHTGEGNFLRGSYSGRSVERAEKLFSIARPGQILLSSSCASQVRGLLPDEVDLLDLGQVKFPDFQAAERVFQIRHLRIPDSIPLPRPETLRSYFLPEHHTSFVGRVSELESVGRLLGKSRLVTLTGSAGCGKTRLAIQAVKQFIGNYPDGVWMADFSSLRASGLLIHTVASVLGIRQERGRLLAKSISYFLQGKKCLLLLDNCEHVLAVARDFVRSLLRSSSPVAVLITGREALRLRGELSWEVPPLSMPDPGSTHSLEALLQSDVVKLFVERAMAASNDFSLTEQNLPVVAEICGRLEGIPLAIELAAARLSTLSLEEMRSKLLHRFRFLAGGSADAILRHQTLRTAIDWSYNLLSRKEQILLCRLSVFRRGFALGAVQEVCGEGFDKSEILPLLSRIVEKSFATKEGCGENLRYMMLESIREYAAEKLEKSGKASDMCVTHLRYFLKMAEDADARLVGADQSLALKKIESELDNLRAALEWCEENPSHQADFLRLAGALYWFWSVRGYLEEGRGYLNRALERDNSKVAKPVFAKALYGACFLAFEQGDYTEARKFALACLEISREISDRKFVAISCNRLAEIALVHGEHEKASEDFRQSLEIFQSINDRWNTAIVLNNLGVLFERKEEYEKAEDFFKQSLDIYSQEGDSGRRASVLHNLGELERVKGNCEQAKTYYQEALEVFEELGDRGRVATALLGSGEAELVLGNLKQAIVKFGQGLKTSKEIGDRLGMAWSVERIAWVTALRNAPEQSVRLFGGAGSLFKEIGYEFSGRERFEHDHYARIAGKTLDAKVFSRIWCEGESLTYEVLFSRALDIVNQMEKDCQ